jgi:hypothetical protein
VTGFLSLQPGLHRIFGEEPPAPNSDALGQVLSPGELVESSDYMVIKGY